jgi:hypothetical protein
MAELPKQPITFRFGPVDQDTGVKHLRPGILTAIENGRQLKKHDWRPRRGYGRTAFVPASSSWRSSPDSFVYTDTRLMLDGFGSTLGGQAWAYDTGNSNWLNKGSIPRPFPTSDVFLPTDQIAHPQVIRAGNNDWYFAVSATQFIWRVVNFTTGVEVLSRTTLASAGTSRFVAVQDGTNIWVFSVFAGTSVFCTKFVVATPSTAPVTTTYQTIANTTFRDVDAHVYDNGEVFVVAGGENTASASVYSHSVLNKGTGQASGAPAPVTTTVGATGNSASVSILVDGGGSGSAYYSVWRNAGAGSFFGLYVHQVTRSTNAIAATSAEIRNAEGNELPASCGILNGGTIYVLSSSSEGAAGAHFDSSNVKLHTATTVGGAWTTTLKGQEAWLVTKPFLYNSEIYYVTGSSASGSFGNDPYNLVKSAYHLRAVSLSVGRVLAQVEYGLAGDYYNNGRLLVPSGTINRAPCTHRPITSGDTMFFAGLSDGAGIRIKLDFAASYGPGAAMRNKMVVPGPIPFTFDLKHNIRELTPLLAPTSFTPNSPSGIVSPVAVQWLYRFVDQNGDEDLSPPSATVYYAEASLPLTVAVPTMRTFLGDGKCQIEVYMSDAGGTTPLRRFVRENNPSVESVSVSLNRAAYDAVDPVAIYTTGGALSSFPAPPSRSVAVWRNRVLLSGTTRRGQIQPSMEMEDKRGPRFNPILASFWRDITSDILRIAPVNWDECAVFTADRVGVFSGLGPNGKGQGPYTVKTLPEQKGILNARAVVSGANGCYFQSRDLQYYLVAGGHLNDIGDGVVSYTSPTSATLHNADEKYVQFFLEDGKILNLDYGHPTEEQPHGQWSVWFSSGLTRAYAATMVGSSPEHVEIDGARRTYQSAFTDTNSSSVEQSYNMKLESGELAVFDLGRQFRLSEAVVHGDFVGSTTLTAEFFMDWGGSSLRSWSQSRVITAAPFQRYFKPSGGDRLQSVKFVLTIPATNGGAVFNGLTLIVQDRGNIRHSNANQRITT